MRADLLLEPPEELQFLALPCRLLFPAPDVATWAYAVSHFNDPSIAAQTTVLLKVSEVMSIGYWLLKGYY